MDGLTFLGIIVGFGAIIFGQHLEGGSIHSLLNFPAFLIVVGGTLGAAMLQTPYKIFKRAMQISVWAFKSRKFPFDRTRSQIVDMARKSRQLGLIALEELVDKEPDPIIKMGLELLVVGIDKVTIRHVLETEIDRMEANDLQAAKVYESMGGYAPTIGILGAVLGLIHVMQNLSDPNTLGSGIAVAFVATIYGVGLANLLIIPIAHKIKTAITQKVQFQQMIVEGMVCMAGGESPQLIALKLNSFDKQLSYGKKKKK